MYWMITYKNAFNDDNTIYKIICRDLKEASEIIYVLKTADMKIYSLTTFDYAEIKNGK